MNLRRLTAWFALVTFFTCTTCPTTRAFSPPKGAFEDLARTETPPTIFDHLPLTRAVLEEARANGIAATSPSTAHRDAPTLAALQALLSSEGPLDLEEAATLVRRLRLSALEQLKAIVLDTRFAEEAALDILAHMPPETPGTASAKADLLATLAAEGEKAGVATLARLAEDTSRHLVGDELQVALSERRGDALLIFIGFVIFVVVVSIVDMNMEEDEGIDGIADAAQPHPSLSEEGPVTFTVTGERPRRLVVEYPEGKAPAVTTSPRRDAALLAPPLIFGEKGVLVPFDSPNTGR